jgi:phage terminase small subunit
MPNFNVELPRHPQHAAALMAEELPTTGAPPRPLSIAKQLKLKQQQFCEYYVHHGNAARAAREAGYGLANARFQGAGLLRNTKVRAYIHELRGKYALDTQWEMEDAYDKLDVIYDAAMKAENYHAAVRAVEAQTKIKMGAMGRINAVAMNTLDSATVPEQGALVREADFIRRYTRPSVDGEGCDQDMSPEVAIGTVEDPQR